VRQFFESRFNAWAVQDGSKQRPDYRLLRTLLNGSRTRSERTPWPVYGVPADLLVLDYPAAARQQRAGGAPCRQQPPAMLPGKTQAGAGEGNPSGRFC
jgi:membrane-bound lytic murein transglycosylase A